MRKIIFTFFADVEDWFFRPSTESDAQNNKLQSKTVRKIATSVADNLV